MAAGIAINTHCTNRLGRFSLSYYIQFRAIAKAESANNDKVTRLSQPHHYRHLPQKRYIVIIVSTVPAVNGPQTGKFGRSVS